jgi:hypothetical protein
MSDLHFLCFLYFLGAQELELRTLHLPYISKESLAILLQIDFIGAMVKARELDNYYNNSEENSRDGER